MPDLSRFQAQGHETCFHGSAFFARGAGSSAMPGDAERMNANATPDNPVQPAAAPADAEEPSWIEIGSPKRRTAPPAWSDEASGDAPGES